MTHRITRRRRLVYEVPHRAGRPVPISSPDVCPHLIRRDHGSEVADQVARMCVVPPRRGGGQAPYIQHPVPEPTSTGTAAARQGALEHLHEPMTLTDLAEHSPMSMRTFARRFTEEVGMVRDAG